ncbi:protein AATF-like [Pyrus x bretschneideri]|uniref:protein AATF-like n=1 Tax=Pyrus x bretschneideri TaxID=225117 RepID=UPI002030646B|nr:protein AATF-like [Pyrus x bretschneideri]
MRDPSRVVRQMQMRKSAVSVFGAVPEEKNTAKGEETQSEAGAQADGDPELLDDSEFYQQLLREFFETIDPASSGKIIRASHTEYMIAFECDILFIQVYWRFGKSKHGQIAFKNCGF